MAITRGAQTRGAAVQAITSENYLDIQDNGWAQQYLPDLMEKEAEVFGKRTISGFLSQVGAEEAMSADQVIWSEQGRLHLSYICDMLDVTASTINILTDIDGVAQTTTHGIRVGDMVLISGGGQTVTARVSVAAAASQTITVQPYSVAHMTNAGFVNGDNACTIMVFGSEYAKGTAYLGGRSNEPQFTTFTNKPIIMKDMYEVSGSDVAQVGWIEVSGEDGQDGYYWYLKAEGDTRARFTDYCEMALIEAETVAAASAIALPTDGGAGTAGTEGLFSAIETRGHQSSGITGVNCATDLAEFDAILAEFDRNGAIEENMMFVNRATALAIDDMLACMNSYGAGGTSYGVFNNSEDMALNLGFSGFRRGSYDFYKSDWKYLNDLATRGGVNLTATAEGIRGVMIPAGVTSVYDQALGKNLKRPFLHVRYRASQLESRKMKTWITGSVGAVTSDLDAMTVNFLTERCMVTQGANNFMLLN
jgi:hypothetical protein|tara:strand:+ start:974 stop:2404 length:1431 start_codon:yes stop_codon:yes gene_type:complete